MAIEPLLEKLGNSVKAAQAALRARFMAEVDKLSTKLGHGSDAGLREELAFLVDDFISEMASTYEDLIATIEEELPETIVKPKPAKARPKPKKPADKNEPPPEPAFVKPTHVQKVINDGGLRISAEAKPRLMAMLNEAIKRDIDRIRDQLPRPASPDQESVKQKQRITIRPEDVEKGLQEPCPATSTPASPGPGGDGDVELATVHVDPGDPGCKILLVARAR